MSAELPAIPLISEIKDLSPREIASRLMPCCPDDYRDIFGELLDAANLHCHRLALPMILRELVKFQEMHATKVRQTMLETLIALQYARLLKWFEAATKYQKIQTSNINLFREYAEETLFPNNDKTLIVLRNELEARGLLQGVERPVMVIKRINGQCHTWIGAGPPDSEDGKWVRQPIRFLPDETSDR